MLDISPAGLLIASLGVLVGACLQGALGIGFGLVSAPVLALVDIRFVPAPIIGASVILSVLMAYRERAALDLPSVSWAIAGRVVGAAMGSVAVALIADRWLAILLSVSLLGVVAVSIGGWSIRPTPRSLFGAGTASGFSGTTTSIGGPPMALVYQHQSGQEMRSALATFQLFGGVISLVALAVAGEYAATELALTGALILAVVLGFVTSRWAIPYLDRGRIRPAVLSFAVIAALVILAREIT